MACVVPNPRMGYVFGAHCTDAHHIVNSNHRPKGKKIKRITNIYPPAKSNLPFPKLLFCASSLLNRPILLFLSFGRLGGTF